MAVDFGTAELSFHILFFIVALVTPAVMFAAYRMFRPGEFRTVVGYLSLTYMFAALAWILGTLAKLGIPLTRSPLFIAAWAVLGVAAVVFAVYAAHLMRALAGKRRR